MKPQVDQRVKGLPDPDKASPTLPLINVALLGEESDRRGGRP